MKKWYKRIAISSLLFLMLSAVSVFFVVEYRVDEMFGGQTVAATHLQGKEFQSDYLLKNAQVLNPAGDSFLVGQDVHIRDGLIIRIGENLPALDPKGQSIPIVNANGHFLIPGYTDSHVHLWRSKNDLLLYLANGVTQVREMHGVQRHLNWKKEIDSGELLGPDLYVVASQLATFGFWEGLWIGWTSERNIVRTPEQASERVQQLAKQGYDAVKASSFVSREIYLAIGQPAKEAGLELLGHIPMEANLDDLFNAQQSEVAHVEEFVKALDRDFGGYTSANGEAFISYVRKHGPELAERVKTKGIAVASTLAIINSFTQQKLDIHSALDEHPIEYMNPGLLESAEMGWLPDVNRYRVDEQYRKDDWRERVEKYWGRYAEAQNILLQEFVSKGVPILAGTDANVPVMVPGFSLHREFQAMVNAGMTAPQVLTSATQAPADWMQWPVGKVHSGYRANLVLLRENPLENIEASSTIESVIVRGNLLDRKTLDQLLNSVREANDSSRAVDIREYL